MLREGTRRGTQPSMHIPPRAETLELLATIALLCVIAVVAALRAARRSHHRLQIDQIDRLRRAELSLASAGSLEAAARELSEHAIALLGARSAPARATSRPSTNPHHVPDCPRTLSSL